MSDKLAALSTEIAQKVYRAFSQEKSPPSDKDLSNWRTFTGMILAWEARHKKHAKRECALKLEAIARELGDKSADADKLMELYRSFIRGQYSNYYYLPVNSFFFIRVLFLSTKRLNINFSYF